MATGGWGKRATSRIDRTQFEHDELLKSLGTQFNVDFTGYDQWQRRTKVVRPYTKTPSDTEVIVGHGKSGAVCKHSTIREKKQAAKLEELHKQQSERVKILELRLKTRKRTLEEYLKRFEVLLVENIKLKTGIDGEEKNTFDGVKGLLRRYEKYRVGISTLNSNFSKELIEVQKQLEDAKKKLRHRLKVVEDRVTGVDLQLAAQQEELRILLSYKDKEYPVKAMKISNLQQEISILQVSNTDDQDELEHIITTEIGKYEKKKVQITNKITRNVTEKAVSLMHPSLKDMALQNMVMKKEMGFHLKEQEELEKINTILEEEVNRLLRDPKTNIRLQMFPEFFPTQEKCTPDMDVLLDIPTKEWLPI